MGPRMRPHGHAFRRRRRQLVPVGEPGPRRPWRPAADEPGGRKELWPMTVGLGERAHRVEERVVSRDDVAAPRHKGARVGVKGQQLTRRQSMKAEQPEQPELRREEAWRQVQALVSGFPRDAVVREYDVGAPG